MKRIFLFSLLLAACHITSAQGINFETGDWKTVLDKASKEHKLVYVDVYTTWCGPCKILAQQIFPKREAGAMYNKHFVNYRIDAEQGEGIALARDYAVTGYPTHLFIDPVSRKVVYRDMGATSDVSEFNRHGTVALQEYADPMTLEKYATKFRRGEKSEAFLKAYLEKAHRLQQPNDAILDRYVDVIVSRPVADSNIEFLLSHIQTANSKAVPYVFANSAGVVARKQLTGPKELFSSWSYRSFEQAAQEKNPAMLDSLRARTKRLTGTDDEVLAYWYQTQYFKKIGDEAGAIRAGAIEADFLASKTDEWFAAEDAKTADQGKASIRAQLKMMQVDTTKLDELVELNVKQQPAIIHSVSFGTAMKLNEVAWDIYEKHAKDSALVSRALVWSRRSLDLVRGMTGWSSYADTYAHLLYASGRKDEAVKVQEEAVAAAGEADAPSLKQSLDAMKAGKL